MAIIDFCCKDITVYFESDGVMDEEWVVGGCWRLDERGWMVVGCGCHWSPRGSCWRLATGDARVYRRYLSKQIYIYFTIST